jgi:hypothetical protein
MCKEKFSVVCALLNYHPGAHIVANGNSHYAEFGGDLPRKLVDSLRQAGADILRYNHRGVVSTVVNF